MENFRHRDTAGDSMMISRSYEVADAAIVRASGVYVSAGEAVAVAQALLDLSGSDALVVELPETKFNGLTVSCQGLVRYIDRTDDIYSGEYERTALKMLALARRLRAERDNLADRLSERRNAVLAEMGSTSSYEVLTGPLKKAVDKIIELQDTGESK